MTKFYRFVDRQYSDGVRIVKEEFNLAKETPCGYWIKDEFFFGDRWVSKTARKRFAYPSESLALESFIARKKKQIRILESQLNQAKSAYQLGLELKKEGDIDGK